MDNSKYSHKYILDASMANDLDSSRTGSTKYDLLYPDSSATSNTSSNDGISPTPVSILDTSRYGHKYILDASMANDLDSSRTGSTKYNLLQGSCMNSSTISFSLSPILEKENANYDVRDDNRPRRMERRYSATALTA